MAAASAGSSIPAQQQYQQQSHGPGGGGAVAGPSVGMSNCGGTLATATLGQLHGAGSAAAAGRQFLGKVSGSGQNSGVGLVTTVQQVQQNKPSQKQQLQQPSGHPPHHIAGNNVLQQQNQPNLVSGWKRALSNGDIVYLR